MMFAEDLVLAKRVSSFPDAHNLVGVRLVNVLCAIDHEGELLIESHLHVILTCRDYQPPRISIASSEDKHSARMPTHITIHRPSCRLAFS